MNDAVWPEEMPGGERAEFCRLAQKYGCSYEQAINTWSDKACQNLALLERILTTQRLLRYATSQLDSCDLDSTGREYHTAHEAQHKLELDQFNWSRAELQTLTDVVK